MHRGFAKLWRKSLDSQVWSGSPELWKVWSWCLMKANHKDGYCFGEKVSRGEFITGRTTGAAECGINQSAWYRALKQLSDHSMVVLKTNSKRTTVSICNYSTYNDLSDESEQQVNSGRTADEQRMNTNKNDKNYKNEKNIGRKRPAFVKPSIDEITSYCMERKNHVNANQFYDHYESNGWMVGKSKMKDWRASVRTWERNNKMPIRDEISNLPPKAPYAGERKLA